MKQGLLFDLDGTLVDSLPGITASLNHALSAMGFPTHGSLEVRRFIGNGSWMLAKRGAPQDAPDEVVAAIELAFKAHYDLHWQGGTSPYPGVPEMLAELHGKGHPMAVLSNKPHPFTTVIVGRLFPGIPFDAVVGQKEGIPHKPDPAGALEIVRIFGLPPQDCMLVGDSTIDLETARNAGIRSVAVTWGYHDRAPLAESGPGLIIDQVGELPRVLE